jgi:acyl-coenzyme A thioesterase PaaI-like protein
VEIHFVKPTYVNDVLELEATVKERLESRQVVVLQFRFRRDTTMVANGRVTVMICNL